MQAQQQQQKISFKPVLDAILTLILQIINHIAVRYNLDATELQNMFDFDMLGLKKVLPKATLSAEKQTQRDLERQLKKESQPKYAPPFCPEHINPNHCQSLVFKNGLFTQCARNMMMNKETGEPIDGYCCMCTKKPEETYNKYGTVSQRLKAGLYDYTAPNGDKPLPYFTILKLPHTPENIQLVKADLERCGFTNVPNEHFNPTSVIPTASANVSANNSPSKKLADTKRTTTDTKRTKKTGPSPTPEVITTSPAVINDPVTAAVEPVQEVKKTPKKRTPPPQQQEPIVEPLTPPPITKAAVVPTSTVTTSDPPIIKARVKKTAQSQTA